MTNIVKSNDINKMNNNLIYNNVIIHPLVLLSVVDHFNRSEVDDYNGRVCGILLGEIYKGKVDITNSYAVPFEEDDNDPTIWFFDHNYHEKMYHMYHKVSAKEKIVGWYSSGSTLTSSDLDIHELIRKYCPEPVFVLVDVNPANEQVEIPTKAYISIEDVPEKRSTNLRTFIYIPSSIGAYEAEEVGVEHLLREIRDIGGSTIADLVASKIIALKAMKQRLLSIIKYLSSIAKHKIKPNYQILYNIQNIINSLPNISSESILNSFKSLINDNSLMIYISSLIRSILSLHDLINNKLELLQNENENQQVVLTDKPVKQQKQ